MMKDICDLGIVCSHPRETRAIVSLLKDGKRERFSLFIGYIGFLCGISCVIIESGMGRDRAYLAAKQTIPLFKPRVILDFGVAAGVNPALCPGTVFLAKKSVDLSEFMSIWEKRDPFFTSTQHLPDKVDSEEIGVHSEILDQIVKSDDIKTGTAGSADFFLRSSLVRDELARRAIDIFDYETFSVLKAAVESGIPALSVRGVSDSGRDNAQEEFQTNLKKAIFRAADFLPSLCKNLKIQSKKFI